MGVFCVETADLYLGSCDAPLEVYQIKNSCQSNNLELDLKVNSSVRTQIAKCTTAKSSGERCEMPKTFVFYDLLSMSRMNNRVGYSSQCALEGTQPIEQKEVWMQIPLVPNNVYWSDGKGMKASIDGSLLAYVPLCKANFVNQPIGVNFTMDSLNEVILQGYVDIPLIKAVIEGTVFMEYKIAGWYHYSGEQYIKSSASFSLKLLASVFATDILLEHPSRNGLTAVKSGSVSATLNISELGEIYDFSFLMEDSTFCTGSPYGFNLCPYIENFIYNTYRPELLNLVILYAEAGFADLANELALKVQNATYTEVDFWGLESACSLVQCDGKTLNAFVAQLHLVAWMHIVLLSLLFPLSCCSLTLLKRTKQYNKEPNLKEIESNPLLACEKSGRYGSII